MSGGIVFPNPANANGQPNLADIINSKKSKASSKSGFNLGSLGGGALKAFDVQNNAGSLAEAIEKQAANQQAQAQQKSVGAGGSTDPYSALAQQLFGAANNINVAGTPIDQLKKMADDQAAAQFNPQIDALMAAMGTHGNRATASENEARKMYGALSKDYLSQMPDVTAQYKAEDASTNQRYDQAQQQMNAEYQQNAGQQDAVLKQLGIQAAAPEASQQTKEDQAYFQNQSESDQQNALNALAQQQSAQTDYTRNLGDNAKMAGENTAQDIRQQLDDYLGQAQGQLSGLQSGRSSAAAALLAQMEQQDASRVQSQSQNKFDNMMKLYNFQLDATKAGQKNSGAGGFGSGTGLGSITSGLQGADNYLANVYPNQPILAKNLMTQLNDVLSNKDVVNGKFVMDPGNPSLGQSPKYSDVGQQYMMDLLKHQFEGQGNRYSTGDINATMNALLAYLGKLH